MSLGRRHGRALAAGVLLVLFSVWTAAQAAVVVPRAEELAADLAALTAPGMEGRASGTPGGERAARYIADRLGALGLRPGGDGGTFFQWVVIGSTRRVGAGTALERVGPTARALEIEREWMPHGGSASSEVTGEVVFVGFGAVSGSGAYDDYSGVDVKGKIALALDGGPPHLPELRPSRLEKLIAARRQGARALLLVSDTLPTLGATGAPVGLASASVTPAAADTLLPPAKKTADLTRMLAGSRSPAGFATGVIARLRVALEQQERRAPNVVGILPGTDPSRASEAVVIGGHYDHLGRGRAGEVYVGADDNASGTSVVLGLARAFAAAGGTPRTVVFVLFGGEELGLLGSDHYVRQPPVPVERTIAMLNFDMVGRLREGKLSIGGVESGAGLRTVVTKAVEGLPLSPTLGDSPFAFSDHTRFYTAGIPTLFFHTGGHDDYHRPTDTPEKINVAGMVEVAAVGARVIERLAGDTVRPAYVTLQAPERKRRGEGAAARAPGGLSGTPAGVAFLGISPDREEESDGLLLGSIVPDSGAARAGMRRGDVLVRLADVPVNSFQDLTRTLAQKRPGDTVTVVYLRDGHDQSTTVTLGARP